MLEVDGICVRFGGVLALDDVSLSAHLGTITGVIGPNGAGKTTLFDVITGLRRPQTGRVILGGDDLTKANPVARARKGVARTFQRLEIFGSLTVRENIRVAAELHRSWSGRHEGVLPSIDEVVARVGLDHVAHVRADLLPTGSSRLMELGRALAIRPSVLLLDEPGSGLDDREMAVLEVLLGSIASEGTAVVLVEHDVDLVMRTCSNVWVLDSGRVIAAGTPTAIRADASVQRAYLGTDLGGAKSVTASSPLPRAIGAERPPPTGAESCNGTTSHDDSGAATSLEVNHLRTGYGNIEVLHDVTLRVEQGELLAVLGPNGAGKTTLLRAASGELHAQSGDVRFAGKDIRGVSSERLARDGLCTIPEGRGVFPNLTVAENLQMWTFGRHTDRSSIEEVTYQRFPVLAGRRKQLAGTLSGGEQQMLAVSRALTTKPKVLLLDEISMGLAPRVVSELYQVVSQLAAEGIAILLVEQFAHTALELASRVAVLRNGRIVFTGDPKDVGESLGDLYLGKSSR